MIKHLEQSTITNPDKHLNIFKSAQELYELSNPYHYGAVKILSYGCSYGHEVKAIKKCFKLSEVIGCDNNEDVLCSAGKNNSGAGIRYVSSLDNLQTEIDIIFCLNVLCHFTEPGIEPKRITPRIFNKTIDRLYSKLAMGGYLVVFNSNYTVMQSNQAQNFKPIKHHAIKKSADTVKLFHTIGTHRRDDGICIFQKIK